MGHKLKNKYITTQEQTKRALEDIFNKTGPSRTPEIEAQIAGFKRRAQKERKPLEDVIRSWFNKNKLRHRLSPKNVEVVINRILELA